MKVRYHTRIKRKSARYRKTIRFVCVLSEKRIVLLLANVDAVNTRISTNKTPIPRQRPNEKSLAVESGFRKKPVTSWPNRSIGRLQRSRLVRRTLWRAGEERRPVKDGGTQQRTTNSRKRERGKQREREREMNTADTHAHTVVCAEWRRYEGTERQ